MLLQNGLRLQIYYASEIDDISVAISQARHAGIYSHEGDATKLHSKINELKRIDLLIASPPCNDLSHLNPNAKGFHGMYLTILRFFP